MTDGSSRSVGIAVVLLVAALSTFVRTYLFIKLVFVVLFLGAAAWSVMRRGRARVYPPLIVFYLVLAVTSVVWVFVGLMRSGNFETASVDAFRLYGIWSLAFIVLFTLLRSESSLMAVHRGLVLSGILIPVVNVLGLVDGLAGWGLIPQSVRDEMVLVMAVQEGYIEIGSANIMLLFVIVPYLVTLQLRRDAAAINTRATKLSFVLSLALTVISGRRAVWIVVAATPIIVLLLSMAIGRLSAIRRGARQIMIMYTVTGLVGVAAVPLLPADVQQLGAFRRLASAFSATDERAIQKPYLIDGLAESPAFGSGFGGYAGYLRSPETPWMYELTYYQMAFNLGLVGMAIIVTLFATYFFEVGRLLRRFPADSSVPFALLVGFLSFLLGAYSNPYFGGFDSLFYIGLLPYLATFRSGFSAAAAGGSASTTGSADSPAHLPPSPA